MPSITFKHRRLCISLAIPVRVCLVPKKGKQGGFETLDHRIFPRQINEPLCVLLKGLEVGWW